MAAVASTAPGRPDQVPNSEVETTSATAHSLSHLSAGNPQGRGRPNTSSDVRIVAKARPASWSLRDAPLAKRETPAIPLQERATPHPTTPPTNARQPPPCDVRPRCARTCGNRLCSRRRRSAPGRASGPPRPPWPGRGSVCSAPRRWRRISRVASSYRFGNPPAVIAPPPARAARTACLVAPGAGRPAL